MTFLSRDGIAVHERANDRLEGFIKRCQRLGIAMDIGDDGRGLMKSLVGVQDPDIRIVLPFACLC